MSSSISNSFPEEPLTESEEEGSGFFPASLGVLLHSRYKVLRKLGRGENSTTWLVSDSLRNSSEGNVYHAIKILTARATKDHHDGHRLELEAMQTTTTLSGGASYGLPCLLDHFEIDGPHGRHLCIVTPVLSETVSSFRRSAPSKSLDSQKVKMIFCGAVEALIDLHAANIIHTDMKADNLLFEEVTGPASIDKLLDENPQIIDGEFELKGAHYPIMRSQPIPNPCRWNDPRPTEEGYSLFLTLGSAQWVGKACPMRTQTYALRAPEIILGADYGVKVDIWALGCMVFELLTGHPLFHPLPGDTWRVEDDHLAQMMELTGEYFSRKFLKECRKRDEYFDETGKLWRIHRLSSMTLEREMMDYGLSEADATAAGAVIRTCLHLDPERRPSADDLLDHPWMESGHMCCD